MDRAIKNWWVWVLMGILYLVMSGFFFFKPLESFVVLSQFMVALFFVTGVFEIISSLTNRTVSGWGFNLAMGVLQVLIGGYLMKHASEGLPEMMMVFLIMFWLIFYGISAISFSFSLKKMGIGTWWLTLIVGILALIVGMGIPYTPASGVAFMTILLGAFSLMFGIYSIFFGFAVRKARV
ncbi:HdeD family acid-resistance protein [Ignatzschineria sp. LJL83]